MKRATTISGAVLFFVAASLLCVSIAAPGAAAMAAFRALPRLGIDLPEYRAYAGGDGAVMGRVAAGFVLEDLFRITTWTSAALSAAAGVAWIAAMFAGAAALRPWPARVALVAMIVAIGSAGLSQFEEPALTESLARYRELARSGDRGRADDARAAFDRLHRSAERQRQVQLGATLAAIGAAAASLAATRRDLRP